MFPTVLPPSSGPCSRGVPPVQSIAYGTRHVRRSRTSDLCGAVLRGSGATSAMVCVNVHSWPPAPRPSTAARRTGSRPEGQNARTPLSRVIMMRVDVLDLDQHWVATKQRAHSPSGSGRSSRMRSWPLLARARVSLIGVAHRVIAAHSSAKWSQGGRGRGRRGLAFRSGARCGRGQSVSSRRAAREQTRARSSGRGLGLV